MRIQARTRAVPKEIPMQRSLMPMKMVAVMVLSSYALPGAADSSAARCDLYPAGADHAEKMIPCSFSQRQGYITLTRADGVTHELTPDGETPGRYRDQQNQIVVRESGLGDQGQILRFPQETVYVYWSTAALTPPAAGNPTVPYTTQDYDATALLRCQAGQAAAFQQCPAGVLRMEDGQASVVLRSPAGAEFTINFMTDYVNATNRRAEARLNGDTWVVVIDDTDTYEVPLAFLRGG
jgi:hypothetical protein